VGGKLLRILGAARAVLDHPRHRAAIERPQLFAPHQGADQARVQQVVVRRALHFVLEVGRHLEQLAELRIVLGEQVIQHAVADQDHLGVERDRLRLQRHGADQAVHLAERLDADLAGGQRALEALPGERLGQQLERIQQQVAAVGLMQRARLDQQEVGDQRTELGNVLDPSDQVLVGGVVLVDHRRAFGRLAPHQQVDAKAVEIGQLAGERGQAGQGFLGMAELVHALDDVLLHLVQVAAHRRVVRIAAAQVVDQVADGEQHRFLVELAHALEAFAPPLMDLANDLFQFLLQGADVASKRVFSSGDSLS
jgi:hypothetical protein